MLTVKFKRTRNHKLSLPTYYSEHAAAMDLQADIDDTWVILPGERAAVPNGFAIEIPVGYEGQVRPRSGRAFKEGLTIVNSPGTVDADFRGELKTLIINLGKENVVINPGDRIAQLIISPVTKVNIEEVTELSNTNRGEKGFGSSGR